MIKYAVFILLFGIQAYALTNPFQHISSLTVFYGDFTSGSGITCLPGRIQDYQAQFINQSSVELEGSSMALSLQVVPKGQKELYMSTWLPFNVLQNATGPVAHGYIQICGRPFHVVFENKFVEGKAKPVLSARGKTLHGKPASFTINWVGNGGLL